MPVDLEAERLTLGEAAQLLNVHLATVWRWALHGVRGRKLPSLVIGGRRYVYRDDLEQFIADLNADQNAGGPRLAGSAKKAKRRAQAAEKKLDAIGIGN